MGLWTLFSAFSLGNRDQWLQYLGMMVLTGLLIATAIQSIRGARRLPQAEKTVWAWPAGFLGTVTYAVLLVSTVQYVERRQAEQPPTARDYDLRARQNIETLARCAAEFKARSPGNSFPRTLQELSSGGRPCLDAGVASGEVDGYRYSYFPSLPDADGVVRVYDACAEPIQYRETGFFTYVIDESQKMPPPISAGDASTVGITCRGAWRDKFKALRFCAARYAARHPDRGYPAVLSDIGPAGDGCLVTPQDQNHELKDRTNSWYTRIEEYVYIAGPPDAFGRIATYEVHLNRLSSRENWNEVADHLGTVHVAVSKRRLATPRDPVRDAKAQRRFHIEQFSARVQCEDGLVDACAFEAARLEAGGDAEAARAMYASACENYSGAACLWMARALGDAPERAAEVQDRLTKACDFGDPQACTLLADRVAATNPALASRLRLRGCATGSVKSKECRDLR
jgi:hypothetical protein